SAAFCLTGLASSSLVRSASPTFVSVTINSSRASCCTIALPNFGRSLLIFSALCSTKISVFDAMVFSSSWVETQLRSFVWFYFFFVTIPFHFRLTVDVATPAGLDALQEYIPASSSLTFVISKVAVVSNIVIVYFSLTWRSCSFLYQEISGNGFPITVHVNLAVRCLRFLLRSSTVTSALTCNLAASSSIILEAIFSGTFSFTLDLVTTDSVMISSFSSEISAICSACFTDFNSKTLSSSYVSSGNFSSSKANTCLSGCFRSNFSTSSMDFNITISFFSSVFKCICFFFLQETSFVKTSSVSLSSLNDGIVSIFRTTVTSSLKSTTFFVRLRRQGVSIISVDSLLLDFPSTISVSISDTGCNFMSLGSSFSTGFKKTCSGFGSMGLSIVTDFNRISTIFSSTFSFSIGFKMISSFVSSSLESFLTGFNTICSGFASSDFLIFFTGFNRISSDFFSTFSFSIGFKMISSFVSSSLESFLTGFNIICSGFGSSGLSSFFTGFNRVSSGVSPTFSFSTDFKVIFSFDPSSLASFLIDFNTTFSSFGSSGFSVFFTGFNRTSSGFSSTFFFSTGFKVIPSFDSSSLGSFLTGFNTICSGFGSSGLSSFFIGFNRTSSDFSSTFSFSIDFKVIPSFDSSSLGSFLTGFNTICSGFGSSGLSSFFIGFNRTSSDFSSTFSFSIDFKVISSFVSSSLESFLTGFITICSGFGSSDISVFFTGFNRTSFGFSSTFSFSIGFKVISSFVSSSLESFLTGFNTICSGFDSSDFSAFFTGFNRTSSDFSSTFCFSIGFKVIFSFVSSSLESFLTGFNTICSGFGSSGLCSFFTGFNRTSSGFCSFFTGFNRTSSGFSSTFSFSIDFKVISSFVSSSLESFLIGFNTICSGFDSSDFSAFFTRFNRTSSDFSSTFPFSIGFKVISFFVSSSLESFLTGFNTICSGFGSSGLCSFFTGFNRTSSGFGSICVNFFARLHEFFSKLFLRQSMVLFDSRKLEAYPVKNLLMLFVFSAMEVNHKFEVERVLFAKVTIHHQVEVVFQMVNHFCREVKISELHFPSNLDEVSHLFQYWHPSPREPRNRLLFSLQVMQNCFK
ncbi:hypothetical protein ALC53_08737, partial [Atta colombica]